MKVDVDFDEEEDDDVEEDDDDDEEGGGGGAFNTFKEDNDFVQTALCEFFVCFIAPISAGEVVNACTKFRVPDIMIVDIVVDVVMMQSTRIILFFMIRFWIEVLID